MAIQQELVGTVGNETLVGTVGYGGEPPTWGEVLDKPSTFTPSAHRHNLSDINNIDSKQDNIIAGRNIYVSSDGKTINALDASSAAAGETTWSNVLGKPETFTPSAHTHTVSDVTDMPIVCNPNLLDNWYFAKPVNQRGESSYSGNVWTIDRWLITAPSSTLTVNSGYITYGGQTYSNLGQIVCNNGLAGYPVTFSILHKNAVNVFLSVRKSDWTVIARKQMGSGSNYTLSTVTATVPSGYTDTLILSIAATDESIAQSVDILAAKLEVGTQQTLAHLENGTWVLNEIPDYGEQIARCQRYFYRYLTGFALAVSTGTGRRGNAILPQTMVAVPSVSHPGVIGGTVNNKLVYTDHILFHGVADSDTTYMWLDGWTATVAGLGG